jgi:murein DD-endopeptidase MepM/ murein hydrolase activator NlpD
MRKALEALFIGDDGKVSWTAVASFVGIVLTVQWNVHYYYLGWEYKPDELTFLEFTIGAFLFGRVVQRGVYYGTNALEEVKRGRVKAKDSDHVAGVGKMVQKPLKKPIPRRNGKLFIKPCKAPLTSKFRTKERPTHHGVDFAAKGHVPILAAADGMVVRSYNSTTYGQTVILEHYIDGQRWQTLYAHLKQPGTPQGQQVAQGQEIGIMGNTGRSSGQHLHFDIHRGVWTAKKSNAVNPEEWIS